jgi:hypothetical protein
MMAGSLFDNDAARCTATQRRRRCARSSPRDGRFVASGQAGVLFRHDALWRRNPRTWMHGVIVAVEERLVAQRRGASHVSVVEHVGRAAAYDHDRWRRAGLANTSNMVFFTGWQVGLSGALPGRMIRSSLRWAGRRRWRRPRLRMGGRRKAGKRPVVAGGPTA